MPGRRRIPCLLHRQLVERETTSVWRPRRCAGADTLRRKSPLPGPVAAHDNRCRVPARAPSLTRCRGPSIPCCGRTRTRAIARQATTTAAETHRAWLSPWTPGRVVSGDTRCVATSSSQMLARDRRVKVESRRREQRGRSPEPSAFATNRVDVYGPIRFSSITSCGAAGAAVAARLDACARKGTLSGQCPTSPARRSTRSARGTRGRMIVSGCRMWSPAPCRGAGSIITW